MPGAPRKDIFDPDCVGVYHCYNRCSQRARLCGFDPVTQTDFSHRKEWIRERLKELAGLMAIDVLDYAVLDNHLHVVLRNRPDLVDNWTDAEVVWRWWYLCPDRREADGTPAEPLEAELNFWQSDPEQVAQYRARLSDISWLMRLLCQPIARRANRESHVTGRFFAHRFRCQRLIDERALLDWTGRQIRGDKRGAIPEDLAPILERLQIAPAHWVETVRHFGRLFRTAAGALSAMRSEANRSGRRWLYGMRHSAVAFPSVSA